MDKLIEYSTMSKNIKKPPHTPLSNIISNTSSNNLNIIYRVEGKELSENIEESYIKIFLNFWRTKSEDYGYFLDELYFMNKDFMVAYIPLPWLHDGKFKLWKVGLIKSRFLNNDIKNIKMARMKESSPLVDMFTLNETIFLIGAQVEGCRSSFNRGKYKVVLEENFNTEQAFYGILGKGLKTFIDRLQEKMKYIKPVTQELLEDNRDFANLLIRKANGRF